MSFRLTIAIVNSTIKLLQKFNSEKKSWFSTKKACKNTSNTRRNTRRNNRYNSRYKLQDYLQEQDCDHVNNIKFYLI